MLTEKDRELEEAAGIVYLTPEKCSFFKCGDFLSCTMKNEDKTYQRVNLHRLFPFDNPYSLISVLDPDSVEIGIIEDVGNFGEQSKLIKDEIDRKYYVCELKALKSVKDSWSASTWNAVDATGDIMFTVKAPYNNVHKCRDGRILIIDIDENRYVLDPVEKLDRTTRRLIELYLV